MVSCQNRIFITVINTVVEIRLYIFTGKQLLLLLFLYVITLC